MSLATLQLFDTYLPDTQNWAFNLLKNMPDIQVNIAARRFLKCGFFPESFNLKFCTFSVSQLSTVGNARETVAVT